MSETYYFGNMSETTSKRSDNLPLPEEFRTEILKITDEIVALLPDQENRKLARVLLSAFFLKSKYVGKYYPVSSIDIAEDILKPNSVEEKNS